MPNLKHVCVNPAAIQYFHVREIKQLHNVCHDLSNKLQNFTNVFSKCANLMYEVTATDLVNVVKATHIK